MNWMRIWIWLSLRTLAVVVAGAAPQAQQPVNVAKGSQAIAFTSTAPSSRRADGVEFR